MTSYAVYQDFLKINIAQRMGKWGFKINDGSEVLSNKGDLFETSQECEKIARFTASLHKSSVA